MPWTLYAYMLKELAKLLAISTAVLMTVIAFGMAIKPLAEGYLEPVSLVKFVLYTMPTTLQFALPFAGAFASTMLYARMASDNEILACSAAGMSYRRILLPVVAAGLVVMLGMFYLSNWVVPGFFEHAHATLEKDITRVVIQKLKKQQAVALKDWIIYADAADERELDAADLARFPAVQREMQPRWIGLMGAAAIELDEQGRLKSDSCGRSADALLYRAHGRLWLAARLRHASHYVAPVSPQDRRAESLAYVDDVPIPPLPIPTPLRDKPQFLSWPRLQELRRRPETYDRIGEAKDALVQALTEQALLDLVADALLQGRTVRLRVGARHSYDLSAPETVRQGQELKLAARGTRAVQVMEQRPRSRLAPAGPGGEADTVNVVYQARAATLRATTARLQFEPQVEIHLEQVRIAAAGPDASTEAPGPDADPPPATSDAARELVPASWPTPLRQTRADMDLAALLAQARQAPDSAERVRQAAADLVLTMNSLDSRITANLHQRATSAVSSMLLLILGAVLATAWRQRLPLVVYFASFLLAAASVLLARGGGTLATRPGYQPLDLIVIWSGALLLAVAVVRGYRKLSRN